MSVRVFIVAAEPSGDALGADLVAAIRARAADAAIAGVGGALMAGQGVESPFPIDELSVFGFLEGVRAYRTVTALADRARDAALAFRPDVVVLIDSWGFTLRVAQRLRAAAPHIRLVKYVGPQVWATRPGRARTLATTVDHLLCIHAFETPYYAPHGLRCTVVGNPVVGRERPGDGAAFRARHGFPPAARLLVIAPGSRPAEIARVSPVFERAAAMLCAARPDVTAVCVMAPPVAAAVRARAAFWTFPHRLIDDPAEKDDAFAAATAALACSGTVTTEIGLHGAAMVVGYRIGWVTWGVMRGFGIYRAPFATLMNVAAGREVAPEFLQTRCTPERLAGALAPLLDDRAARAAQIAAQNAALTLMGRGGPPAHVIAADVVLREARSRISHNTD